LVAGAFFSVVFFSTVFFSVLVSVFLVAVAVTGLASFLASFTGPELPTQRVSYAHISKYNMADALGDAWRC
jgi:Tfp pilus assembly protein PilV